MNHVVLRDSRTAAEHAEEMLSIATEHGIVLQRQEALFFHGWAMSATAQGTEGIAEMRRALADSTFVNAAGLLARLAEACGRNGLPEEGLEAVAKGLRETDRSGERTFEPELYNVKGELLLMRDPPDEAEAERCFRTAIDIARRQAARFYELRATTSFARLLKRQGKTAEAREMLTEIYNWFTEGFEFADLKDAKALLEELTA